MNRNKAFTLAEVLITLGIIGIIAAMTLPTVITNYQKKQTVAQLKKVYTLIGQSIKLAEVDYEAPQYWDFTLPSEKFNSKYIKPYFKIVKEYAVGKFPRNYHIYGTDGNQHDGFFDYFENPKIVLSDGAMITVQTNKSAEEKPYVVFIVDLNGMRKPNKYGRDMFVISVQPDGGLVPYGVGNVAGGRGKLEYNREKLANGNDYRACNRQQSGAFCAALIIIDGWEIKDDYPW